METLPTELLLMIFTLACTNGGQTACALSVVSRRIREVSRPLRFYSVALSSSPRKLQLLVNRLQDERLALGPRGAAPIVRHLFLATTGMQERLDELVHNELPTLDPPSSPDESLFWTVRDNHVKAVYSHPRQPFRSDDQDRLLRLVDALLHAVAADLESLTFLQGEENLPVDISFPRLRELTVIDGARGLIDPANGHSSHILFPVVARLHLIVESPGVQVVRVGVPKASDMGIASWVKHAPSVTHLRISELAAPYVDQVKALYVGGLSSDHADLGPLPFEHLQQVVIQPNPPPSLGWCGTPLMSYLRFVTALWRSQARAALPVYILPPAKGRGPVSIRCAPQAREDWGARVEGCLGVWGDLSEEYAHLSQEGDRPPMYLTPWKI